MPRLTDAQRAQRRNGIGSSDVAAILGLSRYRGASAWGVYNDKRGLVEAEPETPEQARGHDLEPLLATWYLREMHASGVKCTLSPGVQHVTHPSEPWAFATLDYRYIDGEVSKRPRVVELKAVGIGMRWDWNPTDDDGIPDYVRTQVAWQMWVIDAEDAHVAAMLCGPTDFKIWHVKRDLELEALIVPKMRAFWGKIQAGDPPVIDDSEECRAYLNARYPKPKDPIMRAATSAEEELARQRWTASCAEKASKTAKDKWDNEFIAAIAENTGILGVDGWKATRKVGSDGKTRYRFTPAKSWGAADEDS